MQQRKLDNQNVHGVPASGRVCQKGVLLRTLAQSIDLICLMMAHPTANPGKDHVTLRDGALQKHKAPSTAQPDAKRSFARDGQVSGVPGLSSRSRATDRTQDLTPRS